MTGPVLENILIFAAFYSELISYNKGKEVVYQKWKLAEIVLKAIQDVDEFVSSSEQIWRNLALHHLLTSVCSAVNGCRQNESPNRADKSTAPLLIKRKCVFVIKKWIKKSNCCFCLKYESSMHYIAFSSEKSNLVWFRSVYGVYKP